MPRPSCADAPSPGRDAPPHRPRWDRPDCYDDTRAEIATQAELVATYADTLRMLVGMRDDAGTLYATRKMIAHMRMMTAGVKLLPAAAPAPTTPAPPAPPEPRSPPEPPSSPQSSPPRATRPAEAGGAPRNRNSPHSRRSP